MFCLQSQKRQKGMITISFATYFKEVDCAKKNILFYASDGMG